MDRIAEAAAGKYWVEAGHPDVGWTDTGREIVGTPLSRLEIENPRVAAELKQSLATRAEILAELVDTPA